MFVKLLLSIVLALLWVPTLQSKLTTDSILKMQVSVCRRKSVPVTTNATKIWGVFSFVLLHLFSFLLCRNLGFQDLQEALVFDMSGILFFLDQTQEMQIACSGF